MRNKQNSEINETIHQKKTESHHQFVRALSISKSSPGKEVYREALTLHNSRILLFACQCTESWLPVQLADTRQWDRRPRVPNGVLSAGQLRFKTQNQAVMTSVELAMTERQMEADNCPLTGQTGESQPAKPPLPHYQDKRLIQVISRSLAQCPHWESQRSNPCFHPTKYIARKTAFNESQEPGSMPPQTSLAPADGTVAQAERSDRTHDPAPLPPPQFISDADLFSQ
jgi:hypothetical protein